MTDIDKPFQKEERDLLSLDANDIAHHSVTKWISTILEKCKVRFKELLTGFKTRKTCRQVSASKYFIANGDVGRLSYILQNVHIIHVPEQKECLEIDFLS